MALTPEEEKRKATFDPYAQALVKAMTVVFYNGDEDTAWRNIFAIADKQANDARFRSPKLTPTTTRVHLKATH